MVHAPADMQAAVCRYAVRPPARSPQEARLSRRFTRSRRAPCARPSSTPSSQPPRSRESWAGSREVRRSSFALRFIEGGVELPARQSVEQSQCRRINHALVLTYSRARVEHSTRSPCWLPALSLDSDSDSSPCERTGVIYDANVDKWNAVSNRMIPFHPSFSLATILQPASAAAWPRASSSYCHWTRRARSS